MQNKKHQVNLLSFLPPYCQQYKKLLHAVVYNKQSLLRVLEIKLLMVLATFLISMHVSQQSNFITISYHIGLAIAPSLRLGAYKLTSERC